MFFRIVDGGARDHKQGTATTSSFRPPRTGVQERQGRVKCFYANARSLRNNIDELRGRALDNGFDVIGITETWGGSHISDKEFEIEGYDILRKDRLGRKEYTKKCPLKKCPWK